MLENEYLYTVKEVMKIANVSRSLLNRDMKKGKIKYLRFGRNIRFAKSDVMRYKKEKMESGCWKHWKEKQKSS